MTIAERVNALTLKFAGAVHGPTGANYEIVTTEDGGRLVRLTNADGERVVGKGPTLADAVDALARKLG